MTKDLKFVIFELEDLLYFYDDQMSTKLTSAIKRALSIATAEEDYADDLKFRYNYSKKNKGSRREKNNER